MIFLVRLFLPLVVEGTFGPPLLGDFILEMVGRFGTDLLFIVFVFFG